MTSVARHSGGPAYGAGPARGVRGGEHRRVRGSTAARGPDHPAGGRRHRDRPRSQRAELGAPFDHQQDHLRRQRDPQGVQHHGDRDEQRLHRGGVHIGRRPADGRDPAAPRRDGLPHAAQTTGCRPAARPTGPRSPRARTPTSCSRSTPTGSTASGARGFHVIASTHQIGPRSVTADAHASPASCGLASTGDRHAVRQLRSRWRRARLSLRPRNPQPQCSSCRDGRDREHAEARRMPSCCPEGFPAGRGGRVLPTRSSPSSADPLHGLQRVAVRAAATGRSISRYSPGRSAPSGRAARPTARCRARRAS